MTRPHAVVIVIAALCASTSAAQQIDAKKLKHRLTGDAAGAPANDPQGRMFTQAGNGGR
jgi:hypothetical protein